jgi:hypothetical protein
MVLGSKVFDLAGELNKAQKEIQELIGEANALKSKQTEQRTRLNVITPKVTDKRVVAAKVTVPPNRVDTRALAKEITSKLTPLMLTTSIIDPVTTTWWFEPNALANVSAQLVKWGLAMGAADMLAEMATGEEGIISIYDAVQWAMKQAQKLGLAPNVNYGTSNVQVTQGVEKMAYSNNSEFRNRELSLVEHGLDPKIHPIGSTYEGWEIKEVGKVKGKQVIKEHKWYRPVYSMNITEKMAYSQGLRSGKVQATKFWKPLYRKWKRRARSAYRQMRSGQPQQYVNMN